MIGQHDIDLIDKYLLNQLNESEISEFELRSLNKEFADELSMMQEVKSEIVEFGRLEIKGKISQIFTEQQQKKAKITLFTNIFKYSIAACFLITITTSAYTIVHSNSNKNIYYSHSGGASSIGKKNNIVK